MTYSDSWIKKLKIGLPGILTHIGPTSLRSPFSYAHLDGTWPSVLKFVIFLALHYHRCWLLKNRFHFARPFFYYIAIMICAKIKMFWSWETTHRFSFLRPFFFVTVGMCLASKIKWFIICVGKCDLLVCQIQWGLFGRGRVLELSIIRGRF